MADWQLPKKDRTHEIRWPGAVSMPAQAVRFINHAGFCVLFPVKNVSLPSLYYAVAKRLPARWDKHAQKIWKWRDELPAKRRAFYAKYFKSRATFISLKYLSHFLAMREAAVSPKDAEHFYSAGRISHDARAIWLALADHGPMPTLELRHACKFDTKAGNIRFKKAILDLQCQLIVTHTGGEQETESWASNRFDLVSRAFPKQLAQARKISPEAARSALARQYLKLYPSAPALQISRLFNWSKSETQAARSCATAKHSSPTHKSPVTSHHSPSL